MKTKFEHSGGNETVTYREGISYFEMLADQFEEISIQEMGMTDSGLPLHLVLYSADANFNAEDYHNNNRPVLLINNAIHPGEPDGVDASMMLLRDIANGEILQTESADMLIAIIPFYNVGGTLNRNSSTRVNQNGPAEYGFRGNARNYDLNRDFIKSDTKNALAFAKIFHMLDPDIFLDTHVSNGADYQYVITLISTQKNKLGPTLASVQENIFLPDLYEHMSNAGEDMTPYVNTWGKHLTNKTPDHGFEQFPDYPRYSTGYTTLFSTMGFMTETHMLKPYKDRVNATLQFMKSLITITARHNNFIQQAREAHKAAIKVQRSFDIKWDIDTSRHRMIPFKGYEAEIIPSEVTGLDRLKYHQDRPFDKEVPYYDEYKATVSVFKPEYYIIPQSWFRVINILKANGVMMERLEEDTLMDVHYYNITHVETVRNPYEGHFLHYHVEVEKHEDKQHFRKGDYRIPMNQVRNRYIIETLEPHAEDSFFKWNFFDMILQQKEHFSSYVFEDLAADLLQSDEDLKNKFEQKKASDTEFANNAHAQLDFIYRHSDHAEKSYLRYPVYRIE